MKILVTGASGRLGSRLVPHLARRHKVIAFDTKDPPDPSPDNLRYIQGDIRDPDKLRKAADGIEVAIHLAAIPGRAPHIPPSELFAINVQGTYHLLEAAAYAGARMTIVASSICAIGLPDGFDDHDLAYLPVDEDYPCRPKHTYDLTKRLNETTWFRSIKNILPPTNSGWRSLVISKGLSCSRC